MSRLEVIPTSELPEKRREFYEQIAADRTPVEEGRLGGPFDAWTLNPSMGRRIWQLGGTIRFKPTIDRRYIELAILLTGQLWQAQFEWWAHEPMARDAGLPEEVIAAVKVAAAPTFADSDDDDGDRICWEFCRTLLARDKVNDDLYQRTVARFGEPGVADLINTCGFYTMVSMTLNTFEVQLPDGAVAPFA